MAFANFYASKISSDIGASDTTITVDTLPLDKNGNVVTSGYLVLEARNVTQREIISYTNVSGNQLTGVVRGLGGLTAKTHSQGALIEMNLVAQHLEDALNVPNDIVQRFDDVVDDYVFSGLQVSQTALLVGKVGLGVAYISGYRVVKSADVTGVNFTASKDTYVDIDNSGTLTYTAVNNGAAMPALSATSIRLAKVVTDGSTITAVYNFDNRAEERTGWSLMRNSSNAIITPDSVTYLGNRSYQLQFNGVDYTKNFWEGMPIRSMRTVPAYTKCLSLNGSSQYGSKATGASLGSFTDDFAGGAWVYMTSYQAGTIISRFNGSSGWAIYVDGNGRPGIIGYNGNSANFSECKALQSLPLNRWVFITAQLDMSAFTATTTTSYVMVDVLDVPSVVARGGTNPTALVQAGDLQVGALNATNFFPGYIQGAFYSSAKIPQANVPGLASQGLTSSQISTNNIVSAYSLDNTGNDLNVSSANNLSLVGSPTYASDAAFANGARGYDNPPGVFDHGVVMAKPVFSSNTTVIVQMAEGCSIPTTGGVSAFHYSKSKSPLGFPAKARFAVEVIVRALSQQNSPVAQTWYSIMSTQIPVPAGNWDGEMQGCVLGSRASANFLDPEVTLCTNNTTSTSNTGNLPDFTSRVVTVVDTTVVVGYLMRGMISMSALTTLYRKIRMVAASADQIGNFTSGNGSEHIRIIPSCL